MTLRHECFSYKGSGEPNTLELKFCYDDNNSNSDQDTTFIRDFHASTNTSDQWNVVNVSRYEITCRWPKNMCRLYKNKLDLSSVDRIEFAISNNPDEGDIPGTGKIIIDDVKAFLEQPPPIGPGENTKGQGSDTDDPSMSPIVWAAMIAAIATIMAALIKHFAKGGP